MKHVATADSSFSICECFKDFHCLEKGPHFQSLHSFKQLYSVWTLRVPIVTPVRHVPICASTCIITLILPFTVNAFSAAIQVLLVNMILCLCLQLVKFTHVTFKKFHKQINAYFTKTNLQHELNSTQHIYNFFQNRMW